MNKGSEPLYQLIYNSLSESIQSGKYAPGDRLPSEKEIADQFHVSRITSKKALEMLVDAGRIKRMPGKGSFVMEQPEPGLQKEGEKGKPEHLYKSIGYVVSDFTESYGTSLLAGIEEEASQNDSYIVTRRSVGVQKTEEEAIDALIEMGVDGIIVMPVQGEHYNPIILRLVLDVFPIVLVDRNLKGLNCSFVGTNNTDSAKKATDYLLSLGHRHIGFLSPEPMDISAIEDRIDGFIASHAEHGVAVDHSLWLTDIRSTLPGNKTKENLDNDIGKIRDLLSRNPQITALFATEYNIAVLATQAVRDLGKNIPNDISIICFDGPADYIGHYFYTHVRQKERRMGIMAVDLLLRQMQGDTHCVKKFLDADLIVGESTGPAAHA